MHRRVIQASDLDLESEGRRDYWVSLSHDSIWGDWLIPLTVWVGKQAQPEKGLVAFGSTHGNEYEGPIAIKHLLGEIDIGSVTGRIVLVPVVNPPAFQFGTRESVGADGVNLNRAFVDGAGKVPSMSGATHRIADFVREHIWPHVHVVLDIHAGGDVAKFAPMTSFHRVADRQQAETMLETARWFGMPFIVEHQDQTPGLLTTDSERRGKISIGGEFGWGASINADGVRYARHGILAAGIHTGQMTGKIARIGHHATGTQHVVETIDPACFVPAPWAGHFEPLVECGSAVEQGQMVGFLHDFQRLDEDPWPVCAQLDGYLLAHAWLARVQQGQHIAVIGQDVV